MNVAVRIIKQSGKSALVEWMEGDVPRRAFVPNEIIDGNVADQAVLGMGIPYGAPWESIIIPLPGALAEAAQLSANLHRRGIWTTADVTAHLGAVQGAIKKTYGTEAAKSIVGPFIRAVRAYDKEVQRHD